MQKGNDIKRLVNNVENWQVEFELAKGRILDMLRESYSAFANTDGGHCKSVGYALPTIMESYDHDQIAVTVQVGLKDGKSVAVKSTVQSGSAVKSVHGIKFVPRVAVKRTFSEACLQVVEKCAELDPWLKDDLQRIVQQAVLPLGCFERSDFNCFDTLKEASVIERRGSSNGSEWIFMI